VADQIPEKTATKICDEAKERAADTTKPLCVCDLVTGAIRDAVAQGQERVAFTEAWYAERIQRLQDLLIEKAPALWNEAACILANGTASATEPPTYARILQHAKVRAEEYRHAWHRDLKKAREFYAADAARIAALEGALRDAWAAIGDRLLARGPLSKEYAHSVQRTINAALSAPPSASDPHEAERDLNDDEEECPSCHAAMPNGGPCPKCPPAGSGVETMPVDGAGGEEG
jgi:hypothetical protein